MSTSGENGNGKTDIKTDLKEFELKDLVEISVVTMFFVQKLGKASMAQIDEKIKAVHGQVNEGLLEQALEGLRGRGLLSYARGKGQDGANIQMYKTTKIKWAQPPEVAHMADLLPALVATEEAKTIIDLLNDSEESGDGTKKAKTRLGYTDYHELWVRFRMKNPMVGSQPPSPFLETLVKRSTYKYPSIDKGQTILRFCRTETGDVLIPSDVTSGWIRTGLRQGLGLSDAAANYVALGDVVIKPAFLDQVSLPIIDQSTRKGLGLGTYEVLGAGNEFTLDFRVPKKGIADPMKFVMWLTAYVPRPIRGLSPARGKRFGKLEVVDYKILGESSNIATSLSAIEKDIEDPRAQKIFADLFAKATQYNMSFKEGKGGAIADDDAAELD